MRWLCIAATLLLALAGIAPSPADDKKDDGFAPMFNGKDLTGWVNVNCAPGTFLVKDNEMVLPRSCDPVVANVPRVAADPRRAGDALRGGARGMDRLGSRARGIGQDDRRDLRNASPSRSRGRRDLLRLRARRTHLGARKDCAAPCDGEDRSPPRA